jgi:hypothetical protein
LLGEQYVIGVGIANWFKCIFRYKHTADGSKESGGRRAPL